MLHVLLQLELVPHLASRDPQILTPRMGQLQETVSVTAQLPQVFMLLGTIATQLKITCSRIKHFPSVSLTHKAMQSQLKSWPTLRW